MNKEEFLERLEELLADLPQEERIDALTFYRSYFEDAGEENEAQVIEELGSPEKVVESIIGDTTGDSQDRNGSEAAYGGNYRWDDRQYSAPQEEKKSYKTTAIVLGIILAVLTCPIWGSILIAAIGILIGIICLVFGILVAAVAVTAALFAVGVSLVISGIAAIIVTPIIGIGLVAAGLIILGISILALLLVVLMFGKFLPWFCRTIAGGCKKFMLLVRDKRKAWKRG
jgi:uncharacterized membrane protein